MIAANQNVVKQSAASQSEGYYLSLFAEVEKRRAGREPAWLGEIRSAAIRRFADLGFPSVKHEEWKYTSVAPIVRQSLRPALASAPDATAISEALDRWPLARFAQESGSARLVFVDGRYLGALGPKDLPLGLKVSSLAEAIQAEAEAAKPGPLATHLARYAGFEERAFVALNTAFFEDGALVETAKNTVLEKPVCLLYLSTGRGAESHPAVTHPRNLILVGRGTQVSFVEAHFALDQNLYLTNAVTEVVVGENGIADYLKVEVESERAFHISALNTHQDRSSSVSTFALQFGGALVRDEVRTVLDGEGAEAHLNGLYIISGTEHVDNHTTIDHAKPHCGSREVYKGVLDGRSTGVFNGKIIVRQDAQKTDSKQSNKNLLLSNEAVINTKPQLEIYADDVKCTHGATIGQIDEESLFYLRSRGIGLEESRNLLVQAFANDVIDKIRFEPLRVRLYEALLKRLAEQRGTERAAREGVPEEARLSTLVEGA